MVAELWWIVGVVLPCAFVWLHADSIGQWISKRFTRVDSLKRTAGPQGSTAATDRKSVLPFVRTGRVSDAWLRDRKVRESKRVDFDGIRWLRPYDQFQDDSSQR
jgi:hypothetical protein